MQREHHPKNLKTVPAGNQNSLIKKASAQNGAKALKIMRFLGLVASQGGTISSARKHVFEKECCKSVAKSGYPKSTKSRNPHKYWVFRHI
jgi:hypothetical protein